MRPVHELESPQTVLVWAKRRTAACTIRMTALTDEMNDAKRLDNVKRWLDVLMAEATASTPDTRKQKRLRLRQRSAGLCGEKQERLRRSGWQELAGFRQK